MCAILFDRFLTGGDGAAVFVFLFSYPSPSGDGRSVCDLGPWHGALYSLAKG